MNPPVFKLERDKQAKAARPRITLHIYSSLEDARKIRRARTPWAGDHKRICASLSVALLANRGLLSGNPTQNAHSSPQPLDRSELT
jgi:hypothetical protein